jgi:hypothetical protein
MLFSKWVVDVMAARVLREGAQGWDGCGAILARFAELRQTAPKSVKHLAQLLAQFWAL